MVLFISIVITVVIKVIKSYIKIYCFDCIRECTVSAIPVTLTEIWAKL